MSQKASRHGIEWTWNRALHSTGEGKCKIGQHPLFDDVPCRESRGRQTATECGSIHPAHERQCGEQTLPEPVLVHIASHEPLQRSPRGKFSGEAIHFGRAQIDEQRCSHDVSLLVRQASMHKPVDNQMKPPIVPCPVNSPDNKPIPA
jgi:hypothetical protein